MKHFLTTNDWSQKELASLLNVAGELKQSPLNSSLKGRSIALLFLMLPTQFNSQVATGPSPRLWIGQKTGKIM